MAVLRSQILERQELLEVRGHSRTSMLWSDHKKMNGLWSDQPHILLTGHFCSTRATNDKAWHWLLSEYSELSEGGIIIQITSKRGPRNRNRRQPQNRFGHSAHCRGKKHVLFPWNINWSSIMNARRLISMLLVSWHTSCWLDARLMKLMLVLLSMQKEQTWKGNLILESLVMQSAITPKNSSELPFLR